MLISFFLSFLIVNENKNKRIKRIKHSPHSGSDRPKTDMAPPSDQAGWAPRRGNDNPPSKSPKECTTRICCIGSLRPRSHCRLLYIVYLYSVLRTIISSIHRRRDIHTTSVVDGSFNGPTIRIRRIELRTWDEVFIIIFSRAVSRLWLLCRQVRHKLKVITPAYSVLRPQPPKAAGGNRGIVTRGPWSDLV